MQAPWVDFKIFFTWNHDFTHTFITYPSRSLTDCDGSAVETYRRRILLAVASHIEWDIIPEFLFAKSGGQSPDDTALGISKKYFWSALRQSNWNRSKTCQSLLQVSKDFPIIPEKRCGLDIFRQFFEKGGYEAVISIQQAYKPIQFMANKGFKPSNWAIFLSNVDICSVTPNGN